MSHNFSLTVRPLTPAEIPSEQVILDLAKTLLESTPSWKQGKSFCKNTVHTYSRPKPANGNGELAWYCRVSVHPPEQATFDQFWSKLGENKAENEMQYMHLIKKVQLIKEISPTMSIWTLYYTFGPVVSPRVFTVLQVKELSEETPRRGIVVSIPIDLSSPGDKDLARLEEKGVRARYCSVEQLLELPEEGKVEWRMATSSTPGGLIPQWLAESTMASTISEDVPKFFQFLRKAERTADQAPST